MAFVSSFTASPLTGFRSVSVSICVQRNRNQSSTPTRTKPTRAWSMKQSQSASNQTPPVLETDESYVAKLALATLLGTAALTLVGIKPPLPLLLPPVLSSITFFRKPITDWSQLTSRGVMNSDLVAPDVIAPKCSPSRRKVAPVYDGISKELLRDMFFEVVKESPRTVLASSDEERLVYGVVQRSLLLQFPDLITVQFLDGPTKDSSTLAIYSQSIYGAGDLGVNQKRVEEWLEKLGQKVNTHQKVTQTYPSV